MPRDDPEARALDGGRRRLPRRDIVILPLLALITMAVILGGAEAASRLLYPSAEADSCYVKTAGGEGRFKPDCTSRTKVAEGPWTLNTYNDCGYRTPEACGPKPAGALRVAVVGSSTSAGYLVPYEETFAARAAQTLSTACRRPVEFQNLGGANYLGDKVIPRVDEALSLDPDAMVMVLTIVDMDLADKARQAEASGATPQQPPRSLVGRIKAAVQGSRALYMMQYFLLRADESYLPFYLQVTSTAGYLQTPLPPPWPHRLQILEAELATIAAKAKARGKPFMLVFAPQRAATAMKASGRDWPGYDYRAMPRALAAIAARNGFGFIDATDGFRTGTPVSPFYYTVNGHLNGQGHEILSNLYVHSLLASEGPFAACATPASTPPT